MEEWTDHLALETDHLWAMNWERSTEAQMGAMMVDKTELTKVSRSSAGLVSRLALDLVTTMVIVTEKMLDNNFEFPMEY